MVFKVVLSPVASPERQGKIKTETPSLIRGYSSNETSSTSSSSSPEIPSDQMVCVRMIGPNNEDSINFGLRAVFFKRLLCYFLHNRTPSVSSACYSVVVFKSIKEYDVFINSDNSGMAKMFPNKEAIPSLQMRDDETPHNCEFSLFRGESTFHEENVHPNNGNHWLILVRPAEMDFRLKDGRREIDFYRRRMEDRINCVKEHVEEFIRGKPTCMGIYSYGIESNGQYLPSVDVLLMSEFIGNHRELNNITPSNAALALIVFANYESCEDGKVVPKSWQNDIYKCNQGFSDFVENYTKSLVLHKNFNTTERQKDMSNFEQFFLDTFGKLREPGTYIQEVSQQLLGFYLKYIAMVKILFAKYFDPVNLKDRKKGNYYINLTTICQNIKVVENVDIQSSKTDVSMLYFILYEWDDNDEDLESEVSHFVGKYKIPVFDWSQFKTELSSLRQSIISLTSSSKKRKAEKVNVPSQKKQKVVDLEEEDSDIEDEDSEVMEEEQVESENDSEIDIESGDEEESSEFEDEE